MGDAIFHIIAIAVAALGVVKGYRHGLTGMVTSVLGMAFGLVCAHIFCAGLAPGVEELLPASVAERSGYFLSSNIAAGGVYLTVYCLFTSITSIIRKAMEGMGSGLLNSIIGALFCTYSYLLQLSICYNIIVGWNPESALMRHGKADDGNVIEAVMWIAPTALGSETFSDFALREQLRHARTISEVRNHPAPGRVIEMDNNHIKRQDA